MRVASITMVGQFPDGIDIHVRNLKWALSEDDHIFIITLPAFIESFGLKNDNQVTYIPFIAQNVTENGFINFWKHFPRIIKEYQIYPEWFLFMEEDIWFFAKPPIQDDPKMIRGFLPRGSYRNIMLNDQIMHNRIWEGAQAIHSSIVQNAIEFGIDFSFVRNTFLTKNQKKYDEEFGGHITMSMYQNPDTFDEFGLYCALVEKTQIEHEVKALHVRGPESMHRMYPDVYLYATKERLHEIQKKLPYVDVLLVVAVYYTVGLWKHIHHLDWTKAQKESKREIARLLLTGSEWMTFEEYTRLDSLHVLMNGFSPNRKKV